ncbi:MAG: hypothetical protein KKE37_00865 [Verrucomicrobia bacterium]|nr:hypothetical protein [Verrucomicrobiota bacterium]
MKSTVIIARASQKAIDLSVSLQHLKMAVFRCCCWKPVGGGVFQVPGKPWAFAF